MFYFNLNLFTSTPVHPISCTDPPVCRTVLDIQSIELVQRADQHIIFIVLYRPLIVISSPIRPGNKT